jgi:glycosyltransferase involved in cell wall biosynthesis
MLQNRDIIIFGDDWGRHPSTIQHIASVLSKSNRILWVSSLGLRSPRFRLYDLKRIMEKFSKIVLSVPQRQNFVNIVELHPTIIPFYDIKIVRWLNNILLKRKIQRKLKELNFSNVILLVSTPVACDIVGALQEKSSYYLCFDDYGRFDNVFKSLNEMEMKILSLVDGCFAVSDVLLQTRQCKAGENHFLPQGVDVEHFERVPVAVPEQIKNIKKPIVGFFGLITTWVDIDLVYKSAKAYPSVSFVLIGRTTVEMKKYSGLENFYYLGEIAYDSLPEYACLFDVGIVPFILSELTIASNPIKILEYLALGLPVVSTNLPEAKKFGDSILIAENDNEFISLIGIALQRNSLEEKEERRMKARKYSWDAIGDLLSQKIEEIENKKLLS